MRRPTILDCLVGQRRAASPFAVLTYAAPDYSRPFERFAFLRSGAFALCFFVLVAARIVARLRRPRQRRIGRLYQLLAGSYVRVLAKQLSPHTRIHDTRD